MSPWKKPLNLFIRFVLFYLVCMLFGVSLFIGNTAKPETLLNMSCLVCPILAVVLTGLWPHLGRLKKSIKVSYAVRVVIAILITSITVWLTWAIFTDVQPKTLSIFVVSDSLTLENVLKVVGISGPLTAYMLLFYLYALYAVISYVVQALNQVLQIKSLNNQFPDWISLLLMMITAGMLSIWVDYVILTRIGAFDLKMLILAVAVSFVWTWVIVAFAFKKAPSKLELWAMILGPPLGVVFFGAVLMSNIPLIPLREQIEYFLARAVGSAMFLMMWSFPVMIVGLIDSWLLKRPPAKQ